MQKGKSSYVSLENEFYAESSVVYESGSSRESYAAFTDDEPTAGAAEALAKQKAEVAKKNAERLKFNNGNLLLGMSGAKATSVQVPTLNGSIMGSAGNNPGESYIVPATKNARPITTLESLEIDRENAPGEYKLDYIFKAFGAWFESGKNCFTTMALADGMQPEYANLYGDFTMGMGFETIGTVSISGLKSASGLSKGFVSGDDIIAGSGFGNTGKGIGKETMLGSNGTKLDGSKTIWQSGKTERIDIENFDPGKLPGNIHYHEPNNTKWYLDTSEKIFYDKKGLEAPKKVQKLLNDRDFIKNVNKGLKYLGEDKIK